MGRFVVQHPTDKKLSAVYGFDHALGFFAEVRRGELLVAEYDRLHPPYAEKQGLLDLLVRNGFFTAAEAQQAHGMSAYMLPDEMEPEFRRAAQVLEDLLRAAD
jgi:hypothetical protein